MPALEESELFFGRSFLHANQKINQAQQNPLGFTGLRNHETRQIAALISLAVNLFYFGIRAFGFMKMAFKHFKTVG